MVNASQVTFNKGAKSSNATLVRERFEHMLPGLVPALFQHGQEELLLSGEVVVECTPRYPGSAGNFLKFRGSYPLLGKNEQRLV